MKNMNIPKHQSDDKYILNILVGGWATPLKNMSSSIGMMTLTQYFWENKKWQPNHQPATIINPILMGK